MKVELGYAVRLAPGTHKVLTTTTGSQFTRKMQVASQFHAIRRLRSTDRDRRVNRRLGPTVRVGLTEWKLLFACTVGSIRHTVGCINRDNRVLSKCKDLEVATVGVNRIEGDPVRWSNEGSPAFGFGSTPQTDKTKDLLI